MTFEGVWYVSMKPGPFGTVEKWTWVVSKEEFDHLGRLLALAYDVEGVDYRFEAKRSAVPNDAETRAYAKAIADLNRGRRGFWRGHWFGAAGREQKREPVSSSREQRVPTERLGETQRADIPSVRAYPSRRDYGDDDRPGKRRHMLRVKALRAFATIWGLVLVVFFITNAAYSMPEYLWAIPLLLTLFTGSILAYRVANYAFRAGRHGVESIWKTRIVMTLGLVGTGALLIIFLVSLALSSFNTPGNCGVSASGLPFNCPGTGQSYLLATQFASNVAYTGGLFLGPVLLGFATGEAYLLYRLRHHFTIS